MAGLPNSDASDFIMGGLLLFLIQESVLLAGLLDSGIPSSLLGLCVDPEFVRLAGL